MSQNKTERLTRPTNYETLLVGPVGFGDDVKMHVVHDLL